MFVHSFVLFMSLHCSFSLKNVKPRRQALRTNFVNQIDRFVKTKMKTNLHSLYSDSFFLGFRHRRHSVASRQFEDRSVIHGVWRRFALRYCTSRR
jgi:hypothetical protein